MAQQNGETPAQPESPSRMATVGGDGLQEFLRTLSERDASPSKRVLGPTYPEVEQGPQGSAILVLHHVLAQEMILCGFDDATWERLEQERKALKVQVAPASALAEIAGARNGKRQR